MCLGTKVCSGLGCALPQFLGQLLCLTSLGVPTLCLLCLAFSLVTDGASPKLGVDFQEELLSSSPLVHVPASSLALYRPTQRDPGPGTPASPGSLPSFFPLGIWSVCLCSLVLPALPVSVADGMIISKDSHDLTFFFTGLGQFSQI